MINVRDIVQAYKLDSPILKNINVTFPEGKITGLIGANGAGKSTLLAVIARMLTQQGGDVYLDERNMKSLKSNDIAKQLAILKQFSDVNLRLTVQELVEFGRFPHSKGRLTKIDQQKVDEAIAYLELDAYRLRYIDELSGGQRQRVFLAMIVAQDTKYVLLDEPLNNLDMRYATEMMDLLVSLVRDYQKTIVIVLHDVNFAAAYCDHLIAMKDGEVVKVGSVDEIITKPTLDHVFDHNFKVVNIDGQKVVVYHQNKITAESSDQRKEK